MQQIILASKSKYKKELLTRLKVPFISIAPLFDEDSNEKKQKKTSLTHEKLSEFLSKKKAQSLHRLYPNQLIIGCDQVIYVKNQRLDKPGTVENAIKQLEMLQNKQHQLITSYSIISGENTITKSVSADLQVRALTRNEITNYIKLDMPLDCAGSYKLESLGITLMKKIKTDDFTTITGLPLISLSKDLRELGVKIL